MHPETAHRFRGMEAAYRHRVESSASKIKQLLALGANAFIRDKKGFTALHLAIESQHPTLISLLQFRT